MKFKELKQMPADEVQKKELEMRKELMKLRAQVATGTNPENSGRIREIRRTIAKIQTVRRTKK